MLIGLFRSNLSTLDLSSKVALFNVNCRRPYLVVDLAVASPCHAMWIGSTVSTVYICGVDHKDISRWRNDNFRWWNGNFRWCNGVPAERNHCWRHTCVAELRCAYRLLLLEHLTDILTCLLTYLQHFVACVPRRRPINESVRVGVPWGLAASVAAAASGDCGWRCWEFVRRMSLMMLSRVFWHLCMSSFSPSPVRTTLKGVGTEEV